MGELITHITMAILVVAGLIVLFLAMSLAGDGDHLTAVMTLTISICLFAMARILR